jgi:hypothetical protein
MMKAAKVLRIIAPAVPFANLLILFGSFILLRPSSPTTNAYLMRPASQILPREG